MSKINLFIAIACMAGIFLSGCSNSSVRTSALSGEDSVINARIQSFAVVKLTTDLSKLTEKEKQMIPLLMEAADIMDDLYWEQVIGSKSAFLDTIKDTLVRHFAQINYGPWERLNGNKSFMVKFGEKPAGANFYPQDMTKEEFEAWKEKDKTSQYTLVGRNNDKSLKLIWFHDAYKDKLGRAAEMLQKASELAEDPGLKKYLALRANALVSDDYFASDMAWMEMKNNTIDIVIGPIENYEDE
ncbi:MAG TPA: hypothetical protein VLR52_04150, partial [Bacteroidales bacterium]|nr:hypothetical protein [Bacteroidales bacterium]